MKFFPLSTLRKLIVNKNYKRKITSVIIEMIIKIIGVLRSEENTALYMEKLSKREEFNWLGGYD